MESSAETSQDRVPDTQNGAGAHADFKRIVRARPRVSENCLLTFCGVLFTSEAKYFQTSDVLVWWRDVGQARFPHIAVMARQFLAIPAASATAERVFSFAGLTLSDLRKSLVEGTLEAIMWAKWGSPSIWVGVIFT